MKYKCNCNGKRLERFGGIQMKNKILLIILLAASVAWGQNTDINRLLDRFEFASNKFIGKRNTSGFNEFDLIKVNNRYHFYHFSNNSIYYRCHVNPESLAVAPETLALVGRSVPSVLYENGTWHVWASIATSPPSTCHFTSSVPSGNFVPRDTIANTGDFSVRKCPYNNVYYGVGLTTNTTTRKCVLFTSSSLDQSWTSRGDVTNGDQEWVLNLTSSFADPMLFFYNGSSYLLIVGYIPGVTGGVGLCQFDYKRYRVISNTVDVCKASDTIPIPFNPVFLDDSVNSPRIYYADQAWVKEGYIAYNEAYPEINVNAIDSAKVNGLLTTNKIDIKVSGKDSVNTLFNLNNNQITIKNDLSPGSKEIKFTVPKSDSNIYKVVKIINATRVDSFYTKSFNTIVFTDSIDDSSTATWVYTKFIAKKYGLKSKVINLVRDGKYIYTNETNSQVVLTSVGFPTGWASRALSTGADIVPILPDSTICNRYIRRFDKNTGSLEMVVSLPKTRRLTSYPFSLQLGDSVTTNNSSAAFTDRILSWSFTDSTGNVVDETGNNNNGTLINAGNVQRILDGPKRIIKITNSSSYIDFANFSTFNGKKAFTLITKAKFLDTANVKWLWGHYTNVTTNAFIFSVSGGTSKRVTAQLSRTIQRTAYKEYPATYKDMSLFWHDYCVVYDPTKSGNEKLKLYIDDGDAPLTYLQATTDTLPDLRSATTHCSAISTSCMDNQELLIGKALSLEEWRNYRITTLDSNFAFKFIDTIIVSGRRKSTGNNRISVSVGTGL